MTRNSVPTDTNNEVLIVYKAWGDSIENHSSQAFGYSVIGYLLKSDITPDIAATLNTIVGKDFCWACDGNEPLYKLERFNNIKDNIGRTV